MAEWRARGDGQPPAAAGGSGPPHWVCQICGRPVGRDGYVALFNANPALGPVGTHPVAATPDEPWPQHDGAGLATSSPGPLPRPAPPRLTSEGVVANEEQPAEPVRADRDRASGPQRLPSQPDVGMRVVHAACDAGAHRRPFWVPAPPTLEAWCGFVLAMGRVPWLGRGDLLRLLAFWWRHRGSDVPRA